MEAGVRSAASLTSPSADGDPETAADGFPRGVAHLEGMGEARVEQFRKAGQ